jgi:hypothetical protein
MDERLTEIYSLADIEYMCQEAVVTSKPVKARRCDVDDVVLGYKSYTHNNGSVARKSRLVINRPAAALLGAAAAGREHKTARFISR